MFGLAPALVAMFETISEFIAARGMWDLGDALRGGGDGVEFEGGVEAFVFMVVGVIMGFEEVGSVELSGGALDCAGGVVEGTKGIVAGDCFGITPDFGTTSCLCMSVLPNATGPFFFSSSIILEVRCGVKAPVRV